MKSTINMTHKATTAVSVLVLILFVATCSSDVAEEGRAAPEDEQISLDATTAMPAELPSVPVSEPPTTTSVVPATSAAPITTEPESPARLTTSSDDTEDPLAGCQGRSRLTEDQAQRNAAAIFDRLAETLPGLHQSDIEQGRNDNGIVSALAFSYSLCGVSHGEVVALLAEGELGMQYRRWLEALETPTYTDFVDVYTQQPCLVASEFGQKFIPNYDIDSHAEAVNLAGLLLFNPTDDEIVEIGERLVSQFFGEPSVLSDTLGSLDDGDEAVVCEDLVEALNTDGTSQTAQPGQVNILTPENS